MDAEATEVRHSLKEGRELHPLYAMCEVILMTDMDRLDEGAKEGRSGDDGLHKSGDTTPYLYLRTWP